MSLTWEPIPAPVTEGFLSRYRVTKNAVTDILTYSAGAPDIPYVANTKVYLNGVDDANVAPNLSVATLYYVINPTSTTFQIATTIGGSPVDVSSNDPEYVFEYGPLPTGAVISGEDLTIPPPVIGGAGGLVINPNAINYDACAFNVFSYTDGTRFGSAPSNGVVAGTSLTAGNNFEVRCRPRRSTLNAVNDTDPIGNIYIGFTREVSNNVNQWDYCVNISSAARTIRRFPHPANSALIFEYDENNLIPPRPVFWRHSIWQNRVTTPQLVRFQGINGQMRYLIDDTVIHTSRAPIAIGETFYFAVMFDCSGQQVIDIEILTGGNALIGSEIAAGSDVGSGCSGPFTAKGSTTIISGLTAIEAAVIVMPPLPQGADAPIPTRFQESINNWGEFEQQFGTGIKQANTLQVRPIRRFEIDWDGLTPEQAAVLDAHYERSHQGIPFSITHPHTGEVIQGCRYASYTRGDHVRYTVQSRAAVLMRYV